jgi:hypothetical protein
MMVATVETRDAPAFRRRLPASEPKPYACGEHHGSINIRKLRVSSVILERPRWRDQQCKLDRAPLTGKVGAGRSRRCERCDGLQTRPAPATLPAALRSAPRSKAARASTLGGEVQTGGLAGPLTSVLRRERVATVIGICARPA